MTLKEVTLYYDIHLLETWDHTAHVTSMIHNLIVVTVNLHSKRKMKPVPYGNFHPFRKKQRKGLRITAENIDVLHTIGNIIMARSSRQ